MTNAAAARHLIDEEIALHEAAIRNLKIRRNTHSEIAVLPSEILAIVFLEMKNSASKNGSWMNVAEVCRGWRDVALASPQLWCSFDLSDPDRALVLLKRSRPAPLHISCGNTPLIITEENEDMIKSIMAEIHRIQELDLFTFMADCILLILNMNGTAGASLLQRLRLKSFPSSIATSMPPDILRREMPCLHRLELEDINFSPGLPPLPHLRYLKISLSTSTITSSSLLTSIQYATNLKEIHISGMAKDDDSAPTTTRVHLPHLVSISITSNDIESSAIFANLEYPPSAAVIQRVELSAKYPGQFQLAAWGAGPQSSTSLAISLVLRFNDYSSVCSILCSALPFEDVLALGIQNFNLTLQPNWETIFNRCKEVVHLRFNHVSSSPFRALLNLTDSPLPKLQNIHLVSCTNPDPSLDIFVERRKHLGVPVQAQIHKVDWDGKESISEDEDEKEGDSEDEYDFERGFGAV
ncbi:hypothetical protein CCMSSC00406_0003558 [Pleurotus cornucopiae]|uniref:Uncharacterized protein n=1 Tax=Pleurotus cornucopiae TaxID=5321 RepID=A0ACB7IJP2_PLECO|nr:hypothetical protein CCMSSC00406_0003558 [Pleurotus cornucopiae]